MHYSVHEGWIKSCFYACRWPQLDPNGLPAASGTWLPIKVNTLMHAISGRVWDGHRGTVVHFSFQILLYPSQRLSYTCHLMTNYIQLSGFSYRNFLPCVVECDSAPSFQRQFVKTTWFQKRPKTRCISTAVKVYLISAQEHGIGVSCAVDQIKNADQNAPLCRWYAEIKKQSSPLYVESAALIKSPN
jgi:hypothetical protein